MVSTRMLAAGFVVVVLLAWLFVFGGQQQVAKQIKVLAPSALDSFARDNAKNFINYSDPEYFFTIFYPIGYRAELDPDAVTRVRFSVTNPLGLVEMISVYVSPLPYGTAEFERDAVDIPSADVPRQLMKKEATTINDRDAYLFYLNESLPGVENVFVTVAYINCGEYTAVVHASIPESASADRVVAEYMIRSFRC